MKRICAIWILLVAIKGFSQTVIEPYPLQISTDKTTNIIFPATILSVDRGNGSIIVQKARNAENILLIKADTQHFAPTNISVVVLGGKFYSFTATYSKDPDTLNISFEDDQKYKRRNFLHKSSQSGELKIVLRSIYLNNHIMSFQFDLKNFSTIEFEPATIKFFVRDAKRSKRTAIQELNLIPLHAIYCPVVKQNQMQRFTARFKQFNIPKHKRLVCEVSDENAERVLTLRIKPKTILKARVER